MTPDSPTAVREAARVTNRATAHVASNCHVGFVAHHTRVCDMATALLDARDAQHAEALREVRAELELEHTMRRQDTERVLELRIERDALRAEVTRLTGERDEALAYEHQHGERLTEVAADLAAATRRELEARGLLEAMCDGTSTLRIGDWRDRARAYLAGSAPRERGEGLGDMESATVPAAQTAVAASVGESLQPVTCKQCKGSGKNTHRPSWQPPVYGPSPTCFACNGTGTRPAPSPSAAGGPQVGDCEWPPKKGDRAQWGDDPPFTFTGSQNASGGWNIVDANGVDAGGLGKGAFVDRGFAHWKRLPPSAPLTGSGAAQASNLGPHEYVTVTSGVNATVTREPAPPSGAVCGKPWVNVFVWEKCQRPPNHPPPCGPADVQTTSFELPGARDTAATPAEPPAPPVTQGSARERIAQRFHETYERLAPFYGYMTRPETRVPWERLPANNKELMVHVVDVVVIGELGAALARAETAKRIAEAAAEARQQAEADLATTVRSRDEMRGMLREATEMFDTCGSLPDGYWRERYNRWLARIASALNGGAGSGT